jgi:hypothetical protein
MTIVDAQTGLVIGADTFNVDSAIEPAGAIRPVGDSPVFPAICESARKFWDLHQGIAYRPPPATRPAPAPKGAAATEPAPADGPEYPPLSIQQLMVRSETITGAGVNRGRKNTTLTIGADGTLTINESLSAMAGAAYLNRTKSVAMTKDEIKKLLAALDAVDWTNVPGPANPGLMPVTLEICTHGKGAACVNLTCDKAKLPPDLVKLFQVLGNIYDQHAVAPWDSEDKR